MLAHDPYVGVKITQDATLADRYFDKVLADSGPPAGYESSLAQREKRTRTPKAGDARSLELS